jgi:hypothetical protein
MVSLRLASSRSLRTSFSSSSLDEPQSCQGEGMSDQPDKASRPQHGPQKTARAVGCFVAPKCIPRHPPRPSSRQLASQGFQFSIQIGFFKKNRIF